MENPSFLAWNELGSRVELVVYFSTVSYKKRKIWLDLTLGRCESINVRLSWFNTVTADKHLHYHASISWGRVRTIDHLNNSSVKRRMAPREYWLALMNKPSIKQPLPTLIESILFLFSPTFYENVLHTRFF